METIQRTKRTLTAEVNKVTTNASDTTNKVLVRIICYQQYWQGWQSCSWNALWKVDGSTRQSKAAVQPRNINMHQINSTKNRASPTFSQSDYFERVAADTNFHKFSSPRQSFKITEASQSHERKRDVTWISHFRAMPPRTLLLLYGTNYWKYNANCPQPACWICRSLGLTRRPIRRQYPTPPHSFRIEERKQGGGARVSRIHQAIFKERGIWTSSIVPMIS